MARDTMETVLDVAAGLEGILVDVTGGAPELHPDFAWFVGALRDAGRDVQARTNLTALLDPERVGLMPFLREREVALVASMPCYLEENVRAQRGDGVYEKSVETLRRLNALGYGTQGGARLDLVYNPGDASLPGEQSELEETYRRELRERFGVCFHHLLTIANMPIGRFRRRLEREGEAESYARVLEESFNPETLDSLMCRRQICVDWDGRLYDCDFNLALGLCVDHGAPSAIDRFAPGRLAGRSIVTGHHCFGCTAGHGSSCGGALV